MFKGVGKIDNSNLFNQFDPFRLKQVLKGTDTLPLPNFFTSEAFHFYASSNYSLLIIFGFSIILYILLFNKNNKTPNPINFNFY